MDNSHTLWFSKMRVTEIDNGSQSQSQVVEPVELFSLVIVFHLLQLSVS